MKTAKAVSTLKCSSSSDQQINVSDSIIQDKKSIEDQETTLDVVAKSVGNTDLVQENGAPLDESDPFCDIEFMMISLQLQSLLQTKVDQTGRPNTLEISQTKGHVIFAFTDHSKCEAGFSFTRFLGYAEFVDDSKHTTSFTSDFYFQAPQQCNSVITPETEASDDLTISRLPVGQVYSYCVRAIKEGNYMDNTPNDQELRALTSSSAICETHYIAWESSISGLVTTDPNAGSLAIEDVLVYWQVLTEEGKA